MGKMNSALSAAASNLHVKRHALMTFRFENCAGFDTYKQLWVSAMYTGSMY